MISIPLDVDNSHAMDMGVYELEVFATLPAGYRIEVSGARPCPRCGMVGSDWSVSFNGPHGLGTFLGVVVKAAIRAGWDGESGCWATSPDLVALATVLKAEAAT